MSDYTVTACCEVPIIYCKLFQRSRKAKCEITRIRVFQVNEVLLYAFFGGGGEKITLQVRRYSFKEYVRVWYNRTFPPSGKKNKG